MRLLKLLSASCAILASPLWSGEPAQPYQTASALVFFASYALFAWSAATSRPRRFGVIFADVFPEYVCDEGPFAYVRHPVYASYTLGWLACILQSAGRRGGLAQSSVVGAVACLCGLAWLYDWAAGLEERQFADVRNINSEGEKVAGAYAIYRGRTAKWIPGIC
ncbi:hypothetical protein B0J12DRAFT_697003 [Macrophomina phaseolina]|uniref:Phospholipid methyltransferase n=1 Tax=Macrophomina phaseolina TaxID=35725 RepID=A0ABQ8GIM0_9PEZI|nr:hypothetical protein B0J12DRAFT_697003 [Macrophomina phaseolina]